MNRLRARYKLVMHDRTECYDLKWLFWKRTLWTKYECQDSNSLTKKH